ncbi:MAG: hypothetical protein MZV70_41075 [Desulfobacterales bacterium]|nr:hypothetical protein [Desulfobacterales bacterium]
MKALLISPSGATNTRFLHPQEGRPAALGAADGGGDAAGRLAEASVDLNVEALTPAVGPGGLRFISAMAVQRRSAKEVLASCRSAGVKIIVGGPLFTIEHDALPGGRPFRSERGGAHPAPFLADLQAGRPKRVYASREFPALNATPPPLWRLIDSEALRDDEHPVLARLPFQLRILQRHRPVRPSAAPERAPGRSSGSSSDLYRRGWRGAVFFVDDNFIRQQGHGLRGGAGRHWPALHACPRFRRTARTVTTATVTAASGRTNISRVLLNTGSASCAVASMIR